jgi:hypothetical protein
MLTALSVFVPSASAIPPIIHYQGSVAVNDSPFTGTGMFKFAFVNTAEDTLWSHDGTVAVEPGTAISLNVSNGIFSVPLGDTSVPNMTGIPMSVFADQSDVFLRVWFDDGINGSQVLSPDQRMAAVGFAMMAGQATTVPDGAITSAKLAEGAVTSSKMADGAVEGAKIANGSINSIHLANGAIGMNAITDGAVTSAKLADGAITPEKLAEGAITSTVLDDDAVTSAAIADGSVDTVHLVHGDEIMTKIGLIDSQGNGNLFMGDSAGMAAGSANTSFGAHSLGALTNGFANTAIGYEAMRKNTSGSSNTAVGFSTLWENTSGSDNIALGFEAMRDNTDGSLNTAVGIRSLYRNTSGYQNIAVGEEALGNNTIGYGNIGVGQAALLDNEVGETNLAIGAYSLATVSGSENIGIGYEAGASISTGDHNIYIGHHNRGSEGSGTISIGHSDFQTRAFLAGVHGVTPGEANPLNVVIDSNGQLGTATIPGTPSQDTLFFSNDEEYLKWNPGIPDIPQTQLFELSSSLVTDGRLITDALFLRNNEIYFNQSYQQHLKFDELDQWFELSDDLNVSGDLHISGRPTSSDRVIHFGGTQALEWNHSLGAFRFSHDVRAAQDLHVSGNLHVDGDLNLPDFMVLDVLYFEAIGKPENEGLAWDRDADAFWFSDDLHIANGLQIGDNTEDDVIYFNGGSEWFFWDGSDSNFVISDDLITSGEMTCSVMNITSDKDAKKAFASVDRNAILEKVAKLPITSWQYREDAGISSEQARHIGPMAQDFHAAFGVGADGKHIATVDADGVALASIQALKDLVDRQTQALAEKQELIEQLANRVLAGEKRLRQIEQSISRQTTEP